MTTSRANVLLIGLRGSGKSTLGRHLAEKLHMPFIDMDDETARLLGCESVAQAWKIHHESGFRQAETRVLKKLLATTGRVIALGGGSPTATGSRQLLLDAQEQGTARIIYLRAGARTLRERLADADLSDRPSLTGTDTITEIDLILARRDGPYRSLADEVVNVDGLAEDTVLRELTAILG